MSMAELDSLRRPCSETEPNRPGRIARSWGQIWREHNEAILTGLSFLLIVAAWLFERAGVMAAAIPLYVGGFVAGGYHSAREGLTTLVKEKDLDVDLLRVVAAIGAAGIGYGVDGAMLILSF